MPTTYNPAFHSSRGITSADLAEVILRVEDIVNERTFKGPSSRSAKAAAQASIWARARRVEEARTLAEKLIAQRDGSVPPFDREGARVAIESHLSGFLSFMRERDELEPSDERLVRLIERGDPSWHDTSPS